MCASLHCAGGGAVGNRAGDEADGEAGDIVGDGNIGGQHTREYLFDSALVLVCSCVSS